MHELVFFRVARWTRERRRRTNATIEMVSYANAYNLQCEENRNKRQAAKELADAEMAAQGDTSFGVAVVESYNPFMYQYEKEVGQSKSGDMRFVEKCRERDEGWRKDRDKGFLHRQRRRKVRKLLERDLAMCPTRVRQVFVFRASSKTFGSACHTPDPACLIAR